MKTKIAFLLYTIITLYLSSCNSADPILVENDPDASRIAGDYVATEFIVPTAVDGSFDVLENGGKIELTLRPDYTLNGHMLVNAAPNVSDETMDELFTGSFTLQGDSLQFTNTNNILSNPQLYFLINGDELHGELISISSWIITLKKI